MKEINVFKGKAGEMLRQNSSGNEMTGTNKTPAELLQEDADIEALRAAYRAVVTASAHSVFAHKTLPKGTQIPTEPILHAYQAAVAAFANSIFAASGLPLNSIDHFQANLPLSLAVNTQINTQNSNPSILHPTLQPSPQKETNRSQVEPAPSTPQAIAADAATEKPSFPTQPKPSATKRFSLKVVKKLTIAKKTEVQKQTTQDIIRQSKVNVSQISLRKKLTTQSFKPAYRGRSNQPLLMQSALSASMPSVSMAIPPSMPTLSQPNSVIATPNTVFAEPIVQAPVLENTAFSSPPHNLSLNDPAPNQQRNLENNLKDQPSRIPQIEEQTMQEALEDAMGPIKQDNLFSEEPDFMNLPPMPETWLVKLFSRPKLAASVIGMCVLSSTVYAGVGYWWLNGDNISNAAEPVNMLSLQESETGGNNKIVLPRESDTTLLAQAESKASNQIPFDLAEIKNSINEPTGRPNPFAPLLGLNGEIKDSGLNPEKKKDVLMDLQFVGFVGDINSKDKVAMIKVNDPSLGTAKTLIKKAGSTFSVEGERVIVKSISKNFVHLNVAGESRSLAMSPYLEVTRNTAGSSNTSNGNAASTENTSGETAATSGRLGNLNALSSGNNGNTPNPELQEPGQ